MIDTQTRCAIRFPFLPFVTDIEKSFCNQNNKNDTSVSLTFYQTIFNARKHICMVDKWKYVLFFLSRKFLFFGWKATSCHGKSGTKEKTETVMMMIWYATITLNRKPFSWFASWWSWREKTHTLSPYQNYIFLFVAIFHLVKHLFLWFEKSFIFLSFIYCAHRWTALKIVRVYNE